MLHTKSFRSNMGRTHMLLRLLLALPFILALLVFLLAGENSRFRSPAPTYNLGPTEVAPDTSGPTPSDNVDIGDNPDFLWRAMPQHYPVQSMTPIPTGRPLHLPRVQASIRESSQQKTIRTKRREAIRTTFLRGWISYKELAWKSDELAPISGTAKNPFGGWGATLVDNLDTLWIMGLRSEFSEGVDAAVNIDFEKTDNMGDVSIFETNIRYLGGFLSAYDMSGDVRLLRKAKEVGDMLYAAFDTPNRMPVSWWKIQDAARGVPQVAGNNVLLADIGTFSMEFTRLSLITGDPKWFDAAQKIANVMEEQQDTTRLPGLWPVFVNAKDQQFNSNTRFTLGGMADSAFEYLPKTYVMTGGLQPSYKTMYEKAMSAAIKHIIFRPMIPDSDQSILVAGTVDVRTRGDGFNEYVLDSENQHLTCFLGGALLLGGKVLDNAEHTEVGEKLVEGCMWAYSASPSGIMPEISHMLPCPGNSSAFSTDCPWDEKLWNEKFGGRGLPKGFTSIDDKKYILRPEAIESVFVLYRATGRKDLQDKAWEMFQSIEKYTKTELANAALTDVTVSESDGGPLKTDSMESFWMGETLKYFYLMFSEPGLISLDEWVFNTEAHPLRRMLPRDYSSRGSAVPLPLSRSLKRRMS